MDRLIFLFLAAILAGFALIRVPLEGTVLASIAPITSLIGLLAILVFSIVIVVKAVLGLIGK